MSMNYIRETYAVPAKRGGRVRYHGDNSGPKLGTIKSAKNAYLSIHLDGEKHPANFHPTWKLEYLDDNGATLPIGIDEVPPDENEDFEAAMAALETPEREEEPGEYMLPPEDKPDGLSQLLMDRGLRKSPLGVSRELERLRRENWKMKEALKRLVDIADPTAALLANDTLEWVDSQEVSDGP